MTLPIPTIDLDEVTPTELVDHLRTHSCVIIDAGHGISDEAWQGMISISKAFFDLPDDDKAPARWDGTGEWKGWLPVGSTDPVGTAAPKLLEKFEIQLPNPWSGEPGDVAGRAADFDLWPASPDGFVETWTTMYDTLGALAQRVVAMIIEALDLPEALVAGWTTHHFANLVVNNYMAQPDAPSEGQTRNPGHVDIGGVTLLSAEEAPGGLEVQIDGTWTPVVLPPNAYLVQAGDLLRRWTNNVIPGNMHRVVNPPSHLAATARRTSLVYFHYPAPDTIVVPAPSCVTAGADRTPMRSRDHMMYRQYKERADGAYEDEFA